MHAQFPPHRARGCLNCQFCRKWGCIVQKQVRMHCAKTSEHALCKNKRVLSFISILLHAARRAMVAADREDPKRVLGVCVIVAAGAKEHGNSEPFPMIETTEPQFYRTLSLFSRPLNRFSRSPDLSAMHYFQTTLYVFSEIRGLFIGPPWYQ